jgi:hypothetical protein
LAKAALPSATALLDIVSDWRRDRCDTCGYPKGDPTPVIRAAQIVLDRTGFHPTLAVQAVRMEIPEYAAYLTNDELAEVQAMVLRAKERMTSGAPREDTMPNRDVDVQDAVLVEEDDVD